MRIPNGYVAFFIAIALIKRRRVALPEVFYKSIFYYSYTQNPYDKRFVLLNIIVFDLSRLS